MIKNILITGATGFIGSHLISELSKGDYQLHILKRSFSNTDKIKQHLNKIISHNIDQKNLKEIFQNNHFDIIIHLATNYGKKDEKTSDIVRDNVDFPLELYRLAKQHKVKHFFNADTYWSQDINNAKEAINLYAYTKKTLNENLQTQATDSCKIINLRFFHIFGEHDNQNKFIPYAIKKLKANEDLDMTSALQKLDFLYVKEACKIIGHLINNLKKSQSSYQEIQIGSGKQISLKSFIQKIHQKIHSKSKLNFGKLTHRNNEIMNSKADISTLDDYKFSYTLEEGIKHTIDG